MTTHEALALRVAFLALVHEIDAAIGVAARLTNGDDARGIIKELTPWKKDLEEACADLDKFLKNRENVYQKP